MTTNDLIKLPTDRRDALLSECRDELIKARARYETQIVMQLLAQLHYAAERGYPHVQQSATQ